MQEAAAADGKSCSEFVVRRCLDDGTPAAPEPALPAPVQRRVARSVLALEEMECGRGTLLQRRTQPITIRFIPARAGNT